MDMLWGSQLNWTNFRGHFHVFVLFKVKVQNENICLGYSKILRIFFFFFFFWGGGGGGCGVASYFLGMNSRC